MLARTRTNLLALVDATPADIGQYRMVRLTGTTGSTFTSAPSVERRLALA